MARLTKVLRSGAALSMRVAGFLEALADTLASHECHEGSSTEVGSDALPTDASCLDCNGKGWLHMTSGLRGREVQRCDSCRVFPTDEDATEAHIVDCGCTWAGSEEELSGSL